jgi:hypothetical protein
MINNQARDNNQELLENGVIFPWSIFGTATYPFIPSLIENREGNLFIQGAAPPDTPD